MILNKGNLGNLKSPPVRVPAPGTFDLPEKVLQFGTGVLLRGLPDYFIDKANDAGVFNGRIAVVKSTARGNTSEFDLQDSLYTIMVRGLDQGQKIKENIISSAISRVINAQTDWDDVLAISHSADLEIIISNTTEAGIQLTADDVHASPPVSFPGKLLAVLYERFKHFEGDCNRGLVIIPTELISDNGSVLKSVISALAKQNALEEEFLGWLESANIFCNSLVDRIVPGKPDSHILSTIEDELGYTDELLIIAEAYRLWAIEGDEQVKEVLSFHQIDAGVIITPDITMYKELKLRLLNGPHTLTCAAALLAGFNTVHEAMEDEKFSTFITTLLEENLARAIPYPISPEDCLQFAGNVLDRFRNPYLRHYWLGISTNYTLKLKLRVVPLLIQYYEKFNAVPEFISFGFAAYILFMHSERREGHYFSVANRSAHKIDDGYAEYFYNLWHLSKSENEVVINSLSNLQLWESDLSKLTGFADSVVQNLNLIKEIGVMEAMTRINAKRIHFNETE